MFDDATLHGHEVVAVSWGTPVSSPDQWIYQVQILTKRATDNGALEVRAHCCIGSDSYIRDFGVLGTATNMGEAVRKYGTVTWEADTLTIGGGGTSVFSIARQTLEQHR